LDATSPFSKAENGFQSETDLDHRGAAHGRQSAEVPGDSTRVKYHRAQAMRGRSSSERHALVPTLRVCTHLLDALRLFGPFGAPWAEQRRAERPRQRVTSQSVERAHRGDGSQLIVHRRYSFMAAASGSLAEKLKGLL
jgi:hypothetical protein